VITLRPVGVVRSPRAEVRDDYWGGVVAEIELSPDLPADSLDGLEDFSHAEIIFLFDRVDPSAVVAGARHPRNNPAWPRVGIFAQRAKGRPNRLGTTVVRVLGRDGRRVRVSGLDAVDGSPVLDIKPVMAEFLPAGPVRQPEWSSELMREYWRREEERGGPQPPGAEPGGPAGQPRA
jgi:tRNA-Thr(GGU) m(6)t(6)A37 methyltransferase TsaA